MLLDDPDGFIHNDRLISEILCVCVCTRVIVIKYWLVCGGFHLCYRYYTVVIIPYHVCIMCYHLRTT